MTPEGKLKIKNLLVQHESFRQFPYADVTGHLTIGIGRNLDDRGISTTEAFYLLDDDIMYFSTKLAHFLQCFTQLDENRQIALIDMAFNLGIQGILNFKEMISALDSHDYERASEEIINSKWYKQVGERATCISNIIKTGNI